MPVLQQELGKVGQYFGIIHPGEADQTSAELAWLQASSISRQLQNEFSAYCKGFTSSLRHRSVRVYTDRD